MIFQDGYINKNPFWGCFEDRDCAQKVINDLHIAFGHDNKKSSNCEKKYVLAFKLDNQLYINSRGYYGAVITANGVSHAKPSFNRIDYPNNGVLILSSEYIDDLPRFTNADRFCNTMSEQPWEQVCIPLHRYSAQMTFTSSKKLLGRMPGINYKHYYNIDPHKLDDILIKKAMDNKSRPLLNVGRDNPNFVNTVAREAFAHLLMFASLEASLLAIDNSSIGFIPTQTGISQRLDDYLSKFQDRGGHFLKEAITWMNDNAIIYNHDELVYQLTVAALGNNCQMQPFVDAIMNTYIDHLLLHHNRPRGKFDIFMTTGVDNSIMHIVKTLYINGLLNSGDTIAIISPYIELPELNKYNFKKVYIDRDSLENLNILKDKKIKAVFVLNSTIDKEHIANIGEIVQIDNPDLLIISNAVYEPFSHSYHSFMGYAPMNTIEIYSFSKYFGTAGWNMGMIVTHPENIIDKRLLYKSSTLHETEKLFVKQLAIHSHDHLATPQQALMSLFAIYDMTHPEYKSLINDILVNRIKLLYNQLDINLSDHNKLNYNTIIDIKKLASQRHGEEFVQKLTNHDCLEFVFRLAIDYATIVLPIAGFHGPCWAIRVSLANAPTNDYIKVGKNIVSVIDDMYKEYS